MDGALRLLRLLLVAGMLAFVPHLTFPRAVMACSCIAPQPLDTYADDGHVIFAGRVDGREARGVRVAVNRWFAGEGAAPFTWIAGDFGNGASCGVGAEPIVGTEWIWVAWRPEGSADPSINICAPTADLTTDAGQELLAEAQRTFGSGIGNPLAPGLPDPVEPAATALDLDAAVVVAGGAVVAAGIVVLAGAVVAARGRRPGGA